ncbi:MAG TPA: aldehyde dehydrogenase family protein, partial [Sphingomonas sp.]
MASPNSVQIRTSTSAEVPHYELFIGGKWTRSSRNARVEDFNPTTGALYATVEQAGEAEALRAIEAAGKIWGRSLVSERVALLSRVAEVLESRRGEIVDVLVDEAGSIPGKAHFEVNYCIDLCHSAAGDARHLFGETLPPTMPGQIGFTFRQPLGVVVGISPFNVPLLLSMKKICLALAAGNSFVLKPSEETPVLGLKIASVFEEAGVPPGLLNVIPGPAEALGDVLIADPRVKLVSFTGSTRVGKRIGAEAASHLKKFTLEMGGKSPLIILADADLDYALESAAFGAFFHQGQARMAGSRIIVEDALYDRFAEAFARRVAAYKVGDPRDPDTHIGPLIRDSQAGFISGQIDEARGQGARVLAGGGHEGRLFEATVVADVTPKMRIFDEESFGPVTSLVRARDAEHALELANQTSYGLSAAIITNDLQKAFDLAQRLESGMVHINDCTLSDEPHVPFGGVKDSG